MIKDDEYAKAIKGNDATRQGIIMGVQADQHDALLKQRLQLQQQNAADRLNFNYYNAGVRQQDDQARIGATEKDAAARLDAQENEAGDRLDQQEQTEQDRLGYDYYAQGQRQATEKGAATRGAVTSLTGVISQLQKQADDAGGLDQKPPGSPMSYGDHIKQLTEQRDALTGEMVKEAADAVPTGGGGGNASQETGAPGAAATPTPAATPSMSQQDWLGQARKAMAAGAPKDAVIKRLQERGIDPTGL
jgi:uncharacterized protein (DUF2164 family)